MVSLAEIEAYHFAWGERREYPKVGLNDFLVDDEFQIRSKMSREVVERYKQVYKQSINNDTEPPFPPIILAKIRGVRILVDGFHRVAAAKLAGLKEISAITTEMSRKDAMLVAATANDTHGLPLKKSEYREVFRRFIKAGKHRSQEKRRVYKSYREMAKEIGGIPHTTIRNWMKSDFPKVYAAIGKGRVVDKEDLFDPVDHEARLVEHVTGALREALNAMKGIDDPQYRAVVRRHIADMEEHVSGWSEYNG